MLVWNEWRSHSAVKRLTKKHPWPALFYSVSSVDNQPACFYSLHVPSSLTSPPPPPSLPPSHPIQVDLLVLSGCRTSNWCWFKHLFVNTSHHHSALCFPQSHSTHYYCSFPKKIPPVFLNGDGNWHAVFWCKIAWLSILL